MNLDASGTVTNIGTFSLQINSIAFDTTNNNIVYGHNSGELTY